MADDVEIVFGANIDKLVSGVGQVKEQLNSVREATDKITESAKSMLEVFGIGLSFAGIVEFIKSMSELGEKLEQTADRLGLTTQATVELSGIAKITGTDLESVAMSIERMSLNVQRAKGNAIDPAAQALKVLGLNAKDLVGLPTEDYFKRIADAVEKFNPSLNLTNALMQIGGRSFANLMPILREGSEGWEKYQQQVKAASEGLAGAVPGMADTSTKISLLSLSVQSFGSRLFTVLKPAIDAVITSITKWLQSMDTDTIQKKVKEIVTLSTDAMLSLGNMALTLVETFATASAGLDPLIKKLEVLALGASIGYALGGARGAIGAAGIAAAVGMFADQYQKIPEAAAVGNVKLDEQRKKLEQIVAGIKAAFSNLGTGMGDPKEGDKKNAAAINFNIGQQLNAQAAGIDAQINAEKQASERKKMLYEFDADTFQVTQSQKTQLLLANLDQQYQAEKALDEKKLGIYAGQPEKYAEVQKAITALDEQYKTERLKLTLDGLKQQQAAWTEFSNSLQSSFNGQLRGLLAGTTSFASAFKAVVGDMIIFFIEQVEKMVLQWLIGKTVMSTANKTAAVTDAATAAAANAAQSATILGAIQARVGEVYAGVAAFFAPFLGPAAPAAAAPVAAAVDATASGMVAASAASGDYEVSEGLYHLHDKETVLPAPAAQAFRDMAESGGGFGGGGGLHLHGQLIDGPSLARFFRDNAPLMARSLDGMVGAR